MRYNLSEWPKELEVITQPSTTVPDMAFTIPEIIARFVRGLPITGQKFEIFDGEEEYVPDTTYMSKVEVEQMKVDLKDELSVIQERQVKRNEARKKKLEQDKAKQLEELKKRIDDQGTEAQRTSGPGDDQGKKP